VVPDVIGTEVTGMSFHAPAVGAFSVPWVSSAPGCPEALAYTPATRREADDPASTYTVSVARLPDATAVVWNASATPEGLLSVAGSTV